MDKFILTFVVIVMIAFAIIDWILMIARKKILPRKKVKATFSENDKNARKTVILYQK